MCVEVMRGITEPGYISSSAGRNDSGTFFLPCYACIVYQRRLRVRCGELRGNLVISYPRIGAVLVVAAVKDFAHA